MIMRHIAQDRAKGWLLLLSIIILVPLGNRVVLSKLRPAAIPFRPLDGGRPMLPDVLVTALVTLPNGTIYASGHIMAKSLYAFANPPVVPTGSVWLVSHDRGAHWIRHVSTTSLAVVQHAASSTLAWTDHHVWPADFTANELAIDPRHSTTIYAAGCTGMDVFCQSTAGQHRLLRSTDGGRTWSDAIVFHTTSLLYTGLANLKTNIFKTPALDAVLKRGPAQLPGQALAVAVDPTNSGRVYACMSGIGVLRSDDAGRTWRYSDTPQYGWENVQCDLLIDPRRPTIVYAVDRVNGRIFRSVNAGQTWTLASDFGYRSSQHLYNPTFVNSTLYITGYRGIYKSADQGRHWRLVIPIPSPGTLAESNRLGDGWIAAFDPATHTQATGLYGKRDGQQWRLLVNTNAFGPPHLGGAMDFDAMQADAQARLWVSQSAHLVFTAGAVGGIWRWKSGV